MVDVVTPEQVDALLASGGEMAFLDVREVMQFGAGHPFFAAHVPWSRLELIVPWSSPRRTTPVVVTDGEGEVAPRAAGRLEALGYRDVSVLGGGARAWRESGRALFPEIEVPAKGFGAFARVHGKPDFISPLELAGLLERGADCVVLDARPMGEYRLGNIPGSIDAPGADVLRCFDDLVPGPETTVVVNCMSATRGVLGGLSLVAAGVPNRVRVLHHGTRGWLLKGLELERGASRVPGAPSTATLEKARQRAAAIRARAGLDTVDGPGLARMLGDETRTTYVIDVRSAAEFEAGHIAGARSAPEGSVVMAAEHYFTTRNARLVLVDDDTVRATVAALWLAQMGWGDVRVFDGDGSVLAQATGPAAPGVGTLDELGLDLSAVPRVGPRDLARQLAADAAAVVDVGESDAYCEGHLPGASWTLRSEVERTLAECPRDRMLALTSEDGLAAAIVAADLRSASPGREVCALEGGNAAWRAAGLGLERGAERMLCPRHDHWLASSERPGDVTRNVNDYLAWEVSLLDDIRRAGLDPYVASLWPETDQSGRSPRG